ELDQVLEVGVRNLWYAVAPSWSVTDKPVGLTVLRENIVLWRGTDGKIRILQDHCPHRGAKLSLGSVQDCHIACGYHGVQLDGNGTIVAVPAYPGATLVGRSAVRSYPVREASGCIWAFFGEGEPIHFEIPEDLLSEEWNGFLTTQVWNCNYQYAYDNLVDPMH